MQLIDAETLKVPFTQMRHNDDEARGEYVPPGQLLQDDAPDNENVPAEQEWQVTDATVAA